MEPSVFQFSARERAGILLLCIITVTAFLLPTILKPKPKIPANLEVLVWEAYDTLYEQQYHKYDSDARTLPSSANYYKHNRSSFKTDSFRKPFYPRTGFQSTKIDINKADSALWESLPGIGPGFAGRIVKFRARLGGFVSVDQVAETFGMPDSTYNKIKPYLTVSKACPVQMSLNYDSEAVFKAHPYFRWKMAKQLIAFRTQHGPFKELSDLLQANWMNDSIYNKWKPYLKL